jgi:hypothetical protein
MDKIKTIVNSNENLSSRAIYRIPNSQTGEPIDHLIRFVMPARLVIAKHGIHDWKHSINHHLYVFKEYQICTLLDKIESFSRPTVITMIAELLEVNPILIFNDPDLPF